jgi:3D-(3,5/4)-trihydroxycyclohexane-1,2-dione acylhydrolase (decyclizing)
MTRGSRTVRLTTAQAIVKFLQAQYSEKDEDRRRFIPAMFGIFGHGNVHSLGQALYEYGDDLPYHRPTNEQSMVHTAAAFARTNLRLATLACTSSIGPGATNMITGAAQATVNRLPVLLLPSDYYATRHQGSVLQQLEHPMSGDVSVNDAFRPVSRFFDRISRPEQILTALPNAMRVLTDQVETGAVTIALPQDVQAEAYDFPLELFEERTWRIERKAPDNAGIEDLVQLLRGASRPVVIAGGGVIYSAASDELEEFAESFGVPVTETFAGHGAMRNGSGLALGGIGTAGSAAATEVVKKADLVIAIGSRLTDVVTGSRSVFANPDVKFAHINLSGFDANKAGARPVIADARQALRALNIAAREARIRPDPGYVEEVRAAKASWKRFLKDEVFQPTPGEVMSQSEAIGVLNEESQSGDTVINDAGTLTGDLHALWDPSNGTNCHLEFGYSTMGYALPAGLGVRMAQPEGEVYVFIGDQTYLLAPSELVTALQENWKVTVILSENHGAQSIRALQMGTAGRSFGNELRHRDESTNRLEGEYLKLDFVKNAESMGARGWNVSTPDELRMALKDARAETRSCVIVVETEKHNYGPDSGSWWDISPAEVSNDPVTQELRKQYEQEKKSQRFFS